MQELHVKSLLPVRLDVVLTGINRGDNAGFDIAAEQGAAGKQN